MQSSNITPSSPPPKPPESGSRPPMFQLVWGIALFLMGAAVMFRIPVVIDRLSAESGLSSGLHFLRFCLYLIAIILLGGGIKKINRYWFSRTTKDNHLKNR